LSFGLPWACQCYAMCACAVRSVASTVVHAFTCHRRDVRPSGKRREARGRWLREICLVVAVHAGQTGAHPINWPMLLGGVVRIHVHLTCIQIFIIFLFRVLYEES
jgi:hypothetical protein